MSHRLAAAVAIAILGTTLAVASASAEPRTPPIVRTRGAADALYSTRYLSGASYVGGSPLGNMRIVVIPRLRNEAGLEAYAQAASNPQSLYYRRWLSPQQIGEAFGAEASSYARTAAYFRGFGLRVHVWPQRLDMSVIGPQAAMGRAFGTRFGLYRKYGRTFTGPLGPMRLPVALQVAALKNIVNVPALHLPLLATQPPQPVSGGFGPGRTLGLSPQELAAAYDYDGAYNAGFTGKGIVVGILGTGPISPFDVPNFKKFVNLQNSSSTVTQVAGSQVGDVAPLPVTGPCSGGTSGEPTATCNPEDGEAQLDTEQIATLAKDATVLFYLSFDGTDQGIDDTEDELNQALADNKADILSFSVGGCELLNIVLGSTGPDSTNLLDTDTDPLYAAAAAQGIGFFVSSGDSGPNECQRLTGNSDAPSASYPATDPNVVSVGGTNTPVVSNGRLDGPITTWGVATETGGAEGSGQSTVFSTPAYQTSAGLGSACAMRCEPDVVGNADPITGAALIENSGPGLGGTLEEPIGGTSEAAPDVAAMWALVLQACAQTSSCHGPTQTAPAGGTVGPSYRLGNPNYKFYPILGNATQYAATFYDVTYGESAVPPYALQLAQSEGGPSAYTLCPPACDPGETTAGPGFDQATGLGAPFARALIKAVVGI